MSKNTKSKWMIGLTGTALSAFVITQVAGGQTQMDNQEAQTVITDSMSKEEKELVQLDWSNFNINGVVVSKGVVQSDRQTRRS